MSESVQHVPINHSVSVTVERTPALCPASTRHLRESLDKFQHLPNLFEAIAVDAKKANLEIAPVVIPMWNDQDDLQPGQYVAEIHLIVKKVHDPDSAKSLSPTR